MYPANGYFGIYGLDCEMCYTEEGLELTKVTVLLLSRTNCCCLLLFVISLSFVLGQVTVVGVDGRLVYESLVLPDNEVTFYY